jgi:hypothetical protein
MLSFLRYCLSGFINLLKDELQREAELLRREQALDTRERELEAREAKLKYCLYSPLPPLPLPLPCTPIILLPFIFPFPHLFSSTLSYPLSFTSKTIRRIPNWPRWPKPFVHHDIQQEIPSDKRSLVRQAYIFWFVKFLFVVSLSY